MASFTRLIQKGKNGQKIQKNGKTRNGIPRMTFIRICQEENGDCRKISTRLFGDEKKANQVSLRYENLVKKGVELPPMKFVKLRKHVEVTPEMQRRLVAEWNRLGGDTKKVADKLGISTATVYAWIRKFDYIYFRQNVKIVAEKLGISEAEAEEFLMEKGTFVSPLCEKKAGTRGKKSAAIDENVISDITSEVDELLASLEIGDEDEDEDEDETSELEDMIAEVEKVL